MGKRGPKPKEIVDTTWRPELAYVVGLITSDGCLSSDGLLIDLTSSEIEQLNNFSRCLDYKFNIGKKFNNNGDQSYRIQFKNRIFYDFLLSIGLTSKKSLTIGKLTIPNKYFFDFLRGYFDGDGHTYSYWDPRWKSSFMFYISFTSASQNFINWIRIEIHKRLGLVGHITEAKKKDRCYQLKYAKNEGIILIKEMYKNRKLVCLKRKKLKINKALSTIGVPLIN